MKGNLTPCQESIEFDVVLELCDSYLLARIINLSQRFDCEYAFYLLCDDKKVDNQWYSSNAVAKFPLPSKGGVYVAVGFVVHQDIKVIKKSEPLTIINNVQKEIPYLNYFNSIINGNYQRLKQQGFRARTDSELISIKSPLNFSNVKDRNTEFTLHAWRFLNPIWAEFVKTQNLSYIKEIMTYMRDWVRYKSRVNNIFIWYDMATGIRAIHVAFLTHLIKVFDIPLSPRDLKLLKDLQTSHIYKLYNPSWLKLNNHGIWQVFGLRLLSWSLGDENKGIVDLCNSKLKELLDFSYDKQGVHTENSPFYHHYVSNLIVQLPEDLFLSVSEKIALIKANARVITAWLTDPYGDFYQIGDSEGVGNRLTSDMLNVSEDFFDNTDYISKKFELGYAIVRTAPDCPKEKSCSLIFYGTNQHHIHSHADKLGFILFHKGVEVFTDSGKYIYESGDWQNYFISDKAHNVLGLEERFFGPMDVSYRETKIKDIVRHNNEYKLTGVTAYLCKSLVYSRTISYKPNEQLTILDEIQNETNSVLEQRFHLGIGVEANYDKYHKTIKLSYAGREIATMFVPEEVVEVNILAGSLAPIAGWCSKSYKKKESIHSVFFKLQKNTRTIYTVIKLL